MENAREYVERVVFGQLNQVLDTDNSVHPLEYLEIVEQLNNNIQYYSMHSHITGFTQEDLESFLCMKVHQVLRRKQVDRNKLKAYFIPTFSNFIKDIYKINERAINRGLDTDLIDYINKQLS